MRHMQGFEYRLRKPQGSDDVGSNINKEASTDLQYNEHRELTPFGHWSSSSWPLEESPSIDGRVRNTGNSEGYASILSRSSTSVASLLPRMGGQQQMGSSHAGASGIGVLTNAVSGSTGTVGQQRFQSLGAALPSAQSPMHQHPPSPSLAVRSSSPHQSQSLAEQDHSQSVSLPRPDLKASQFLGQLNVGLCNQYTQDTSPFTHARVQVGHPHKLQPRGLRAASPSGPSFQPRNNDEQQPDSRQSQPSGEIPRPILPPVSNIGSPSTLGNSASDHSDPVAAESSGQASTSHLLAAVMKSGIFSTNSIPGTRPNLSVPDTGQIPSQSDDQPPLPGGPPPLPVTSSAPHVSSATSSGSSSHNNSQAPGDISQKKVGQPPLPPGPRPSSLVDSPSAQTSTAVTNASDPISNLLSSLVAKGLISALKTEAPTSVPTQIPNQLENKSTGITTTSSVLVSSVPDSTATSISTTRDEVSSSEPTNQNSVAMTESTTMQIENVIGFKFKPDVIREFHPSVISGLYDDLPHCCSICGLRLQLQDHLDRHLEWHKKPEGSGLVSVSRRWYADSSDWIAGKAGLASSINSAGSTNMSSKTLVMSDPMVPADESQCACILCGDLFEDFYSQERDKWMFKGAVYMTISSKDGEVVGSSNENAAKGPIVHANCISESSTHKVGLASGVKMVSFDV